LAQTELLDPQGLTPFVALHLGDAEVIPIRRTSAVGFFATDGAPEVTDPGWSFVSYSHLQDCLRVLESETVEILAMPGGGTLMRSSGGTYSTELRVHTVDRSRAGFKRHAPGDNFMTLDPGWLNGLSTRPFALATPPAFHGDQLLLMTQAGIISWQTTGDPGLPSFPREAFLKAISGVTPKLLELTTNGFYHVNHDGASIFAAGHRGNGDAMVSATVVTATPSVTLPAGRFIQALEQASACAGINSLIHFGPRAGVTVKNNFGGTDRFSVGDLPVFTGFSMSIKTAKTIADALKQVPSGDITLQTVNGFADTSRVTRGTASVTFRTIIHHE
jgi:hypothetical protein